MLARASSGGQVTSLVAGQRAVRNVLFGRVHQIELGLALHQLLPAWVIPHGLHGKADLRVDDGLRAGLHGDLEEVIAEGLGFRVYGFDFELPHGGDDGLGAFYQVLEYGRPVIV